MDKQKVVVWAHGRKTGAIGIFYDFTVTVEVADLNDDAVRLAVHEAGYEHVSFSHWRKVAT